MRDPIQTEEFELHFQEMFNGEEAIATLDGVVLVRLKLKTRMQTGLAGMHSFKAAPGSMLGISAGGHSATWKLKAGESPLGIQLEPGGLVIKPVPAGHGYL